MSKTNGAPKSYKVGVLTPGDRDWSYNALRFHTVVEAERYGADLFARWTAVKEYQVHPSEDAPNTDGEGRPAPLPRERELPVLTVTETDEGTWATFQDGAELWAWPTLEHAVNSLRSFLLREYAPRS